MKSGPPLGGAQRRPLKNMPWQNCSERPATLDIMQSLLGHEDND